MHRSHTPQVISYLSSNPAQQGLMALPAVVGQMGQIFIGAALARQLSAVVGGGVCVACPKIASWDGGEGRGGQETHAAKELRKGLREHGFTMGLP